MSKSAVLFVKLLVVGGLALGILVALWLVEGVISGRETYRDEAVKSISASYAEQQRVMGPLLVQPYRATYDEEETNDKGVKKTVHRTVDSSYTIFPTELRVNGALKPSVRRHGLYRVPVYEFQGSMSGHLDAPIPKLRGQVQWGVPYLAFQVADARGIVGRPSLRVNGNAYPVEGARLTQAELDNPVHPDLQWKTNLRGLLPELAGKPGGLDFALDLTLAGTQGFELVPLANANTFELQSTWAQPLFAGQFLPRTREISTQGFHAVWEVSSLASATQQQLLSDHDTKVDAVSVNLANLIDPYTLADRAVKYGILFVLLTFGGFFLFEVAKQMQIHPVQYLLVGFCQCVFFLLLVSFSEHIAFGMAYLLASAACIGLLTYYLVFVLKSTLYGLTFGAILTTLYAAIYGLLVSEDNALLLGSSLLFAVIALIMIATRKVDWYASTEGLTGPRNLAATSPYAASGVPQP